MQLKTNLIIDKKFLLNFFMFKKLKYGIIGAGHLGRYHAKQINNIKEATLVGVYDVISNKSLDLSRECNTSHFLSLESLMQECDAVSIVTPATYHFEVACAAIKQKCHLFIEKPFTKTIKEAEELIMLKNKTKHLIQVGFIERFNPAFIQFKKNNPNPDFIESHRLSTYNSRGTDVNVVLDLMIHDIDILLQIVQSRISNIYASGKAVLTSSIDLANARIEFENGCVANLTASRISLKQMRQMRVFEKNSYSMVDFNALSINKWKINKRRKLEETKYDIAQKNALYEELFSFINSIYQQDKVVVTAEEALESLKVANKIQKKIEK